MAHPVDIHVGTRVKARRQALGLTQKQLAERIGVRFQQLQKYESGSNRVSASRLWQIATVLELSVSWFFEGLEGVAAPQPVEHAALLADAEALELIRSYYAIPEEQRRQIFELARVLSASPGG